VCSAGQSAFLEGGPNDLHVFLKKRIVVQAGPGARSRQRYIEGLDDASGSRGHDDDPVGKEDGVSDAVRDEEDRIAALEPQRLQIGDHLLAGQRVERAEWLVHEQERIVDQRPCD